MKTNICVIGLAPKFTEKVSKMLADKLEMYFADINAMIEFDLINVCEIQDLMGKEYMRKIERKKVREVTSYENTLMMMDFALLNDDENLKNVKDKCLLIYLKINKENYEKKIKQESFSKLSRILNLNVFDDRDFICSNISDLSLNCNNLTPAKIISILKEEILKYYKDLGVL